MIEVLYHGIIPVLYFFEIVIHNSLLKHPAQNGGVHHL